MTFDFESICVDSAHVNAQGRRELTLLHFSLEFFALESIMFGDGFSIHFIHELHEVPVEWDLGAVHARQGRAKEGADSIGADKG